jgi:hypothetical protein
VKVPRTIAAVATLLIAGGVLALASGTASAATVPVGKVSVGHTGSAPQQISVDEYVAAVHATDPGATVARSATATPTCWKQQFEDTLSQSVPNDRPIVFASYGYTGKWCKSAGTLWRMAIMNVHSESTGVGAVIFTRKTNWTVGAGVWKNKYAIGVRKFVFAGHFKSPAYEFSFNVEQCIRSWGDGYGRYWQNRSCAVY